jgi:hypothetical protein
LKAFIFICLFIPLLVVPTTIACTIITASDSKTVLFGGNEDQTVNNSCFLVVDTRGNFGVVYFATPWTSESLVMQMGINEMGLCYDVNWIPKETLNPHLEKQSQNEWAVTQLMKEVSTVEEILSIIFTYNWGDSISYQVHFADKSGDAVVIHPGTDGELTYTRKTKGDGYLVSTNFNLAQVKKEKWSCSRYMTAVRMLSKIGPQNDLTVNYMASILKETHQRSIHKTLYSAVYDLPKLQIYLYYNRRFDNPFVLNVEEELAKTTGTRKVPLSDLTSN